MDRPVKDASRSEWDEYGKYLGLNPDEYANKDALIDAADAAEEELDALAGPDPDAGGPVDELGEAPPPEVTPGKEGKYPEGYEDASDSWKAAYDHAVSHGNPSKTAVVFADINHDSEEFGG